MLEADSTVVDHYIGGTDMLRLFVLFALFGFVFTISATAEEHVLGKVTGKEIDGFTYDHGFVARVGDHIALGFLDEATGISTLRIWKHTQEISAHFARSEEDGGIGGTIAHEKDGDKFETRLAFLGINKETKVLLFKVNDEAMQVSLAAEKFENGHYLNPTYTARLGAREIVFRTEGEACMGLAIHTIFMITGAILHAEGAELEEEHPIGKVSGKEVEGYTYDHGFAVRVGDHIAFGFLDEATGVSTLRIWKHTQEITTRFARSEEDGILGGVISHEKDGVKFETRLSFLGINKETKVLLFKVNEDQMEASLAAEKFENGHYLNPVYTARLGAREISFRVEGEACMGLAIHTIFMMTGAVLH